MNEANGRYRVLFVCTANICRSPAAEALARKRHGEERATFRSAGFLLAGEPSPDLLAEVLGELSIDISQHRSYVLDQPSLAAADLVLTMEGEHVQRATLLHSVAFPKIVPLREAAAVMTAIPPGERVDAVGLLERVNDGRDPTTYLSTKWDVDDPFKRKLKDYRRAVKEIAGLVDDVFGRLQ